MKEPFCLGWDLGKADRTTMTIVKHEGNGQFKYLTIDESLIVNAERHKANAEIYLQNGNLEYAIGSYRKMLRNYEAAQRIKDLKDCGLNDFADRLAEEIAKAIMNGSDNAT